MRRLWDRCRAVGKAWASPDEVLRLFGEAPAGTEPTAPEALQELWRRCLAVEDVVIGRDRDAYIAAYERARVEVGEMFQYENRFQHVGIGVCLKHGSWRGPNDCPSCGGK